MITHFLILLLIFFIPHLSWGQGSFKTEQNRHSRVRQARENQKAKIDSLFNNLDFNYPSEKILIIAYKNERILELWAKPETLSTFKLVKQYSFTAFSGILGPKRKQGDMQIPEGFYHIDHFNPFSNFHLSIKVNYPNKSDSILGVKGSLGGEIRIHGSTVTIGCIPIGNEAIEELYIICVDTKSTGQRDVPVYIFPCHMHNANMIMLEQYTDNDTTSLSFWQNLKEGYDIFTECHQELEYRVDGNGQYVYLNQNINKYSWLTDYDEDNILLSQIKVPTGYKRISIEYNSFAHWLRYLPLKKGNPAVYLYNGSEKSYQGGSYAVIDIDVGVTDLQQCADAIIRLYAEYLYSQNELDDIEFKITNGDNIKYRTWINGYRPSVSANTVNWHKQEEPDSSYSNFKDYLTFIFTYAGTYSLSQQLRSIQNINDLEISDIFIQGGFPGHAVLVADMAIHNETGEKIFLLCQSYMPAQDIHILNNLNDPSINPWYKLDFGDTLYIPEWSFTEQDLKRF